MKVIFLFPLAFAFFGTIFILINDDFGRVAKGLAVALNGDRSRCSSSATFIFSSRSRCN